MADEEKKGKWEGGKENMCVGVGRTEGGKEKTQVNPPPLLTPFLITRSPKQPFLQGHPLCPSPHVNILDLN